MTILGEESKEKSLAGVWGEERRRKLLQHSGGSKAILKTEYQATFSQEPLRTIRDMQSSPMNKFKSMQRSGFSLTSLQKTTADSTGDFNSPEFQETSKSRLSTASVNESDRNFSSSGTSRHHASAGVFPRSVYKDTYVDHRLTTEEIAERNRMDLTRSSSRNLHSSAAPRAIGRSGLRKDRGCSTSGLSGERLNVSSEPHYNSFVQRSWLYADDPALLVKVQGRPKISRGTDSSLILPAENEEVAAEEQEERLRSLRSSLVKSRNESLLSQEETMRRIEEIQAQRHVRENERFGRSYVYTGDVISKTGARRYGVFLDDNDDQVLKETLAATTMRR